MVAILDRNAKLIERVSCDATSGGCNARHHRLGDLTGDGTTTTDDRNLLLGNSREYGVGDLDRDGEVTGADLALLDNDTGGALPAGQLSMTDNIIGYAGYIFNAEIPGAGLYTVRHRHYAPDLGRWLSRDPLGYVDGMSLYEYVRSSPATLTDPSSRNVCGPDRILPPTPLPSDIVPMPLWPELFRPPKRWFDNRLYPFNSVVCNDISRPILVCHNDGCQILLPGQCTDRYLDDGDFWFDYPYWYKCGWSTCKPTDDDPGDGRVPTTAPRFYGVEDCHKYCDMHFTPGSFSYLFCLGACLQ